MKLQNTNSAAMPYVHKPAFYLERQKFIEDMETKSSDQRCRAVDRTENLGASSAPRVGKGSIDQTQSGRLISLPYPPNPTALQRSSKI